MVCGTQHRIDHQHLPRPEMLNELLPAEKLRGFQTRVSSNRPSGRIWPHGEWSYGYAKARPDGGPWHENPLQVSEGAETAIREDWALAQFPLDLSDVSNSRKRPRRGLKGITSYGKQSVKAGGFLMRDRFPHHRMTFATVTIPPLPPEQRQMVVERWPEIVRLGIEWLGRRLERQGLPRAIVSVSEIQPKRLVSTGEGYLHLHMLWLNHPGRKGNWAVNPVDFGAWFEATLRRQLDYGGVDRVNVDVKPVKGDAARYLAKYMSKGGEVLTEAMEDWGPDNCPRQWWNLSGWLRALVKANTLTGGIPGEWLEMLVAYIFNTGDDSPVEFLRHVEVDFDGVLVTVGWRGRLSDQVRRDAMPALAMLSEVC